MPAQPRFVGRSSELTALVDALDAAVAGQATTVLVVGDAGIGKTRLLEEFQRLAGSRSLPVVWGRATNEEGAPPFWPWRQVVRGWLAGTDPDVARGLLGDDAEALARIAPELRAGDSGAPGAPTAPIASPEQRFAVFEAMGRFLVAAAAERGLVLVLDDLHWADTASLLLLAHLARGLGELGEGRLLVVATLRPLDARRAGTPAEVVAEIGRQRATVRIDLAGVSSAEVGEQLAAALGRPPEAELVATVARRTGGNPLFVQEVARLLAVDPGAGLDAAPVPEAVRAAIGQRLDHVPPECRAVLGVAGLIGVDVDVRLVAAAAGTDVETVLDHLDRALAERIVLRSRRPAGYRFEHDLVRDTLLLEVPAAERARAHLRAAEHLSARDSDGHRSEIAHHRLEALPLGDPAAAVEAAAAAAGLALDQLAFEHAAALYGRASAAAEQTGLGAGVHGRLLLDRARAEHLAADVDAAMASCEQAAAVARRAGDAAALGRVAVLMPEVSSPDWLPLVEGWCSEALAGLPAGDSPLRAQLLAQQTLSLTFSGDVDEMDHGSAAALAMAARTGDDAALRHGLRARQMARSGPEGGAERAVLADRMQALGERTGDAGAVLWGHLWRFDTLVQQGRIDEAEAELDRLAVVVARGRPPLGRWHLARSRAALLAGRGRFAEALAAVDDAVRGAEWGQRHIALNSSHAARLLVAVLTGDDLFEPRVGAAALHLPPPLGPLSQLAVAEWHLVHGRTDAAAGIYERLPPPRGRPPPFFRPTLTAYRGWVAAALGDAEGAAAAYEMLLPDADVHVASGAGVIITRGSVRYHLGASAAGSGRTDDAVDQLRRAVDANRASGLVPAAAEAQCRLAEVLLGRGRAGDHTAARAAASAAEATATRLGLRFVEGRARAVAAELHRAGPLSRREHEIAALVARGLTNRQIADEAHIAERTAENHVQHILTKLGFSTRTQIATWFTAGAGATAGAQPEPK